MRIDDWFFQCHSSAIRCSRVASGRRRLAAARLLLRARAGGLGSGRALGCGEVEFAGQIRPHDTCVRTEIDVRRYTELEKAGASMVIGDATLFVDGSPIYTVKRARVGTFQGIAYPDYPLPSANSRGGRMER